MPESAHAANVRLFESNRFDLIVYLLKDTLTVYQRLVTRIERLAQEKPEGLSSLDLAVYLWIILSEVSSCATVSIVDKRRRLQCCD